MLFAWIMFPVLLIRPSHIMLEAGLMRSRMYIRRVINIIVILVVFPLFSQAGIVTLRIRAANPTEMPKTVKIRSNLPSRISPDHVVNLGNLKIAFDVDNDVYYVYGEADLAPKEIKTFNVDMQDIWVLPVENIQQIRQQTGLLLEKVHGLTGYKELEYLGENIKKELDAISGAQAQSSIESGATPMQHIRTYEENVQRLARAKRDVVKIENVVLASRQDPGGLVGVTVMPEPKRREVSLPPEKYRPAIVRITVKNTSPNTVRKISVQRKLPLEIGPDDVLDAGGMDVKRDARTGGVLVEQTIDVAPTNTVVYEVKIRDKWDLSAVRIPEILATATNLLTSIKVTGKFQSVESEMSRLIQTLEQIGQKKGPTELGAEYVAYYREQARQIDAVEAQIGRLQSLLKPTVGQKRGFSVKPPNLKTTWGIIYSILGFLGLLSLLFVLRWMFRSKAERMDAAPGGTGETQDGTPSE